jgi:hypothetical protein
MTNDTYEDVTGVEIVPATSTTLFRTDDPAEVIQIARQLAGQLREVVIQGGMTQRIKGRDHVRIEGWQTLGSMLGVSPYVVWTRKLDDGWEARAEARTVDGRIVGAAEAMVTHAERNWADSDEYALRSMAQTRAMSKALRGPLGFVMSLAGQDATPAEEVDAGAEPTAAELPGWAMHTSPDDIPVIRSNLERILAPTGHAQHAAEEVGSAIWTASDSGFPRIVADTLALIAQMLAQTPAGGPWAPGSGIQENPS